VTSGAPLVGLDLPADGDELVVSLGGSRRPPVVPPSRPSPVLLELDGFGLPLLWLPLVEPLLALGAGRSVPDDEPGASELAPR
jgi:hypothetical protein